ncbi:MAG: hypothetical protein IJB58_03155 [Bacteroidales bacterium]|nr:hypothetical protein [Bacteroidales bacterium]
MSKIKYFAGLIFVLGLLFVVSCTKDEASLVSNSNLLQGQTLVIEAVREDNDSIGTRTIRQDDGSVYWNPGDEISLFFMSGKDGGYKFTSQNEEVAKVTQFTGTISGITGGGEDIADDAYFWAIYPYSSDNVCESGSLVTTLPCAQQAIEETFADDLFITVARSQNVKMAFKNVCGGVKFTVSQAGIKSVVFKGNNGEPLAGKSRIIFDDNNIPVVSEVIDGQTEILVTAPNGSTFEVGKYYYIVAFPNALEGGFSMKFNKTDGTSGTYTRTSKVTIKRSTFGVLNQMDKNVTSWEEDSSAGGGYNSGIYLGIMGFNQQLYSYPISELTSASKVGFDSFIDNLSMKNGTLLYYSVDQTINTMQSVKLPDDLSTVAIVTFTDGLDQGSIMMNSSYLDNTEYLNALNQRIGNEKVSGRPITAYSVGIRGKDVVDVTTFQNNLEKLASADENATEVSSMSEVNAKFKEIAEQLSKSNYVQTVTLKMPGVPNGTLVRFTFDNVSSADKSSLYIEGTFNLAARSLENVKYEGLTSSSGVQIKGVVDGIFVSFTFESVQTESNILIQSQFTDEWTYITSSSIWQINSEFDKNENAEIVTERSSAAIMLVLDCSSSLADDFVTAQSSAKDFINTLYEAVGGDTGSGGTDDDADNPIYSTVPKDLTLAIWKDGQRYYLTKEQYYVANLSDAVIEGLAVVAGGESFVLSLKDVQSNCICNVSIAQMLYKDIMPTEDQGKIISARCVEINNAISSFGGSKLTTGSESRGYYTLGTKEDNYGDFTRCINLYTSSYYGTLKTIDYPYIRGVKSTDYNSAIYWTDPDDLKLSVIIDGNREFLDVEEYNKRKDEITKIEGVAVIAGGERFAIHLQDAQTSCLENVSTAQMLYKDIMPTEDQGRIISAKYYDINSAISSFGGSKLETSESRGYYTLGTTENSYGDFTKCINLYTSSYYGTLKTIAYPYIRGITNLK